MHVPDKISTLCAAAYTYVKNIKDNRLASQYAFI